MASSPSHQAFHLISPHQSSSVLIYLYHTQLSVALIHTQLSSSSSRSPSHPALNGSPHHSQLYVTPSHQNHSSPSHPALQHTQLYNHQLQRWASGRHIATCGDRRKISVMQIFKNDHSEHLKIAICGDRTLFACPPLNSPPVALRQTQPPVAIHHTQLGGL